jgi:hypothetical protein
VTRRLLLAAGAALLARPATAAGQAETPESRALRGLIAREQAAAFAYGRAGRRRLARQEAEHAAALRPHLEALGQPLPAPVAGPADLDPAARRLAGAAPHARPGAAVALEQALLDAYRAALPVLGDPATVRTAATVMASHGQHLVLAAAAAGRDPAAIAG